MSFFESLKPQEDLTLMQLPYKTVLLLALTSAAQFVMLYLAWDREINISLFFCDVFVWKWGPRPRTSSGCYHGNKSATTFKKGIFVHPPWVPNCMYNLKGGWKFSFPKMFDCYRDLFLIRNFCVSVLRTDYIIDAIGLNFLVNTQFFGVSWNRQCCFLTIFQFGFSRQMKETLGSIYFPAISDCDKRWVGHWNALITYSYLEEGE